MPKFSFKQREKEAPMTAENDVMNMRMVAAEIECRAARVRLATAEAEQKAALETIELSRRVAQSMFNRENTDAKNLSQ